MRRSFAAWEVAARAAMADRGVDDDVANSLIDAAEAHAEQSGQDPWEALGSPTAYAAAAAAERPVTERAGRDVHGMTPGDHPRAAILGLAVMAIPATALAALTRATVSFPVTWSGLAGLLSFAVCWVVVLGAPGAVRAAGRPQWVPWLFGWGAVQVVATGAAFTLLPGSRLIDLPAPLIIAVAALVVWLLPRTRRTRHRTAKPPTTAPPSGRGDDDRWLGALRGLLIGRHDVPPRRAADLVTDARQHLALAGGSAHAEFGPVDAYAAELADSAAMRRDPWWRGSVAQLAATAIATAATAEVAADLWRGGHRWIAAVAVVTALAGARTVLRRAHDMLRRR